MYQQLIEDFIKLEGLPPSYAEDATVWFLPLLAELETRLSNKKQRPLVIGINGAQGTGKSTLAKLLSLLLETRGLYTANLSIDDFYLSRARRLELAAEVHPLLACRGVPGTHDTQTALQILHALRHATASDTVILPLFDKATDDCVPAGLCPRLNGPIDVIILEGWFVGARPQPDTELEKPINELEALEDADGRWRHFVNQRLAAGYQPLFSQLDFLILLKAPGFEQVYEWRQLQEEKLRRRAPSNASGLMDDSEVRRFIQHFERLTRHCLSTLTTQADWVFELDKNHRLCGRSDLR